MSDEDLNEELIGVDGRNGFGWIIAVVALLIFLALTMSTWRWLWGEWMGNSYYSHGILILPVALYLGWRRLANDHQRPPVDESGQVGGLVILVISMALYIYFLRDRAMYLAAFAIIGLLIGLIWTLAGRRVLGKLAFPLAFLLLMVPLPFIERTTLPLALFTGVCSGGLVQLLGLDITIVGNAVSLPNAELVIGAQCSGINSIMALLALNALVAYALIGPLWGRVALVLLAVPLAMLGNIIRVATLLYVGRYFGVEAAFSFYHDYSGIVVFVLVMILLIPLAWLLHCRRLRLDVF